MCIVFSTLLGPVAGPREFLPSLCPSNLPRKNQPVKRYEVRSGKPYLVPEAAGHEPIPVREGQELRVWGVAQHVIHEVS